MTNSIAGEKPEWLNPTRLEEIYSSEAYVKTLAVSALKTALECYSFCGSEFHRLSDALALARICGAGNNPFNCSNQKTKRRK